MKHFDTAICFSGELRTFKVAMPRLMKYFNEFQADIFCHTWTTSGMNLHKTTDTQLLKDIIEESKHILVDLKMQTSINHSGPFGNMLYSIQQANFMKRSYEITNNFRYKRVIKCRYDMLVPNDKTFGDREIEDRTIYYSIGNRGLVHTDTGKHGFSDIIFWGDSPSMDIACDTYHHYNWNAFPRYLQLMNGNMMDPKDSMLSPGTLIYQLAQKRNIKLEQIKPQLMETLWRTRVDHLDPDTQFEEIKKAY